MSILKLEHINKIYPNGVQAVFDFNLEIFDHEFVVLVGPSGCGKSTMLRMIAGLESISSGTFTIDGIRMNEKPPVDRNIAMIFQDYALYGNMSVYENMGFSLTVRKKNSNVIHDRVMDVSKIVGLEKELNRYPKNLSGGQRQRVALGRSIVRDANIFLMDEPLSNLDAQLRTQTRKEIILLHHNLRPTIVYVTHDQVEAMTMADRMIVMNNGIIQQVGTPYDIYHHPENLFVASFIGSPAMNFLKGSIRKGHFVSDDVSLKLTDAMLQMVGTNRDIIIGIRPEWLSAIDIKTSKESDSVINATVNYSELLGSTASIKFTKADVEMVAIIDSEHMAQTGSKICFSVDMDRVMFFDPETQKVIKEVTK